MAHIISLGDIKNRAVEFMDDLPEPRMIVYGTPVYHVPICIQGISYLLEVYQRGVIRQLVAARSLKGQKAMIQLPKQEGAEWGARMIS